MRVEEAREGLIVDLAWDARDPAHRFGVSKLERREVERSAELSNLLAGNAFESGHFLIEPKCTLNQVLAVGSRGK